MKTWLRGLLPHWMWNCLRTVRGSARSVVAAVQDMIDRLVGRHPRITPPRRLMFVGPGDFHSIGERFLGHFRELADLQPHERVLDVGCGVGRMAIPLTEYLAADGSYDGFDVVPPGVEWCRKHITPRHPNFRFHFVDIRNTRYNPSGAVAASEFRFPFEDNAFDFAFLTSVFTHMLPDEVDRYLAELQRVLAPGGRCLITWFLLNDESTACIHAGRSREDFTFEIGACLTVDPVEPERAVAYREERARELYAAHGFALREPIHYGRWCGRGERPTYQDMCVADLRV